jgi:thiamine-phosphate pyrophosphorylase
LVLRAIDANLDRLGEGLRTLEDIARFLLNDAELCGQLKSLRHGLLKDDFSLQQQILTARKAEEDVGAFASVPDEEQRKDLPSLAIANAKRAQESLRALEEFAKLPDISPALDPAKFKQARFDLYSLEQKLVSRLLRQDKADRLTGLYVIIDTEALKGRSEVEVAHQVIQGGARVIQLRDKQRSRAELLEIARGLKNLCSERGVLFVINDYLDLALAVDSDGLHLGPKDLPMSESRRLMPMDKLIGCSAATLSEAVRAQSQGADYIAVGSIYPTSSKEEFKLVGLETLQQVRKSVSLPLVAIGGIDHTNVEEVMKAGADSIAVIKAVLGAKDAREATRELVARIEASQDIIGVKNEETNL